MAEWFDERCLQLRDDLEQLDASDDAEELKLKLIRVAMRESSLEVFRRAAQNSRAKLEEMGEDTSNMTIEQVEKNLLEDIAPDLTAADIMPDLTSFPGISEAMAKAEEKFRTNRPDIATDDEDNSEQIKSQTLSASDLNLDKFLKKPGSEANNLETEQIKTEPAEPVHPSPESRIKIKSSILRRK